MNDTLNQLLSLHCENEIAEFKEAKNSYAFDKIGKYFSALCNEANLKHLKRAWLVFGVKDNQTVVGSQFRTNAIKRMFGYSKVRYRGLAKNTNRLYVLAGLANLLRSQKYLLA